MILPPDEPVIVGGDRACAGLLLELGARIAGLPGGTLIYLTALDPAAPIDLPAWCHLTGHAYLGAVPAPRRAYALRTISAPAAHRPGFSLAAPLLSQQHTPNGALPALAAALRLAPRWLACGRRRVRRCRPGAARSPRSRILPPTPRAAAAG